MSRKGRFKERWQRTDEMPISPTFPIRICVRQAHVPLLCQLYVKVDGSPETILRLYPYSMKNPQKWNISLEKFT